MAGKQYADGDQLVGSWGGYDVKYCWNLNGQYSALTAILGLDDSRDTSYDPPTITFEGDGNTIQTFKLSLGGLPQNISIPVSGVKQLTITSSSTGAGDLIDLANATLTQ